MSDPIPASVLEKFTTFGDLLRFLRRRAGITQLELSIAVGYSDAQISRLEQNLRQPDIPTIQARFISALDLQDEPGAITRLLDLAANIRREDAPGPGDCPYKGLNQFEESDADLFVGREMLTSKLTERVLALDSSKMPLTGRFLAVVGASGSGKSSLVRAGLIPALRWNNRSADWQIQVLTPTAHPLESLAEVLTQDETSVAQTATLIDDLARDPRSLHLFTRRKLGLRSRTRILLIVDQFEEVFALCRSEVERDSFIGNLLSAASEVDGPVIVIIALRADFYSYCGSYLPLREALAASQEFIGAMTDEELRRAIEEPARRGRWEFEEGLADLLLHDVEHEPGALPLLSHALMETWQRRRGRTLTLSGYSSSGGVRGAIAETAESVFSDRFTSTQHEIARRIFLRLTELGDETATGDTRRRAGFNELILRPEEAYSTREVLKVLADARLIITGEDSVEVAHEALIREWPRLRSWLEDNRDDLRLHHRLTEAAQEWIALGREPEMLYRGARLTQAQEWALTHDEEMNGMEHEFLDASALAAAQALAQLEAQRQRELEAAQRLAESEKQRAEQQSSFAKQMSKRAMYLTGALLIALLMAFTALYFGSRARQTAITAQNDRRLATARELAAASLNNLSVDPERSILLAQQSIAETRSADGTVLPESLDALHLAIVSSPIRMTLDGHGTWVLSAAYSPDGSQLATIGEDGTVIFWNASDGREMLRIQGTTLPNDFVSRKRVAYGPDGKWIAASDRNEVKIYDTASGATLKTLEGQPELVTSVAVSQDGKHIASGGLDGSVMIWDMPEGAKRPLAGHAAAIEELALSPDGKWLATTGDDAALKIWDVDTGNLLLDYTDTADIVSGVAFSPDGKQLAFSGEALHVWSLSLDPTGEGNTISTQELLSIPAAGSDCFSSDGKIVAGEIGGTIVLWDSATGRELLRLAGHTDSIMGLAFSPDDKSLASTSMDGKVKIWDITPGRELTAVSGPISAFGTRVVYSPNGDEFAANGGGSASIWNSSTSIKRLTLSGHDQDTMNLAYSPDGNRLATGSLDGTAIIWDASTGRKLLTLSGHEAGVRDVAFSPDGSLIATASFDGTARIWNGTTGEPIHVLTGHKGIVLGVAFNPAGTRVATCGTDQTVKIWDARTGVELQSVTDSSSGVRDVAYSPDGTKLASANADGSTIIWDAATGMQIMKLAGHTSGVLAVTFSPDSKLLATGSADNSARVWDLETGAEVLSVPGSVGGVIGVAFSPADNGAHLAVASADGTVRIFLLQIDELLALAQSRVTRTLTADECKKYLHVNACP